LDLLRTEGAFLHGCFRLPLRKQSWLLNGVGSEATPTRWTSQRCGHDADKAVGLRLALAEKPFQFETETIGLKYTDISDPLSAEPGFARVVPSANGEEGSAASFLRSDETAISLQADYLDQPERSGGCRDGSATILSGKSSFHKILVASLAESVSVLTINSATQLDQMTLFEICDKRSDDIRGKAQVVGYSRPRQEESDSPSSSIQCRRQHLPAAALSSCWS
jgi:hypothetical protein